MMLQLAHRAAGIFGALLSIASIIQAAQSPSTPLLVVAILVTACLAAIVVVDGVIYVRGRPHRFAPASHDIQEYMKGWLESGGRAAIFTRDLSWATPGAAVYAVLEKKAKRNELLIFVAERSATVDTLLSLGAEVYSYPKQFVPRGRFTIIDYEKHGARVAIGVVEGKWHVVRESSVAESPMSPVIEDLVALAKAAGKRLP